MTTTMTITEYAATHGASRQAAKNWTNKGALVMIGDHVDVEASALVMQDMGLGRFRVAGHGGRRAKGVYGVSDRPGATDKSAAHATALAIARQDALDKAYPDLARARHCNPPRLSAMIERAVGDIDEVPVSDPDELNDLIDTVAWYEFET